ncbi:MAG: hypothetical protein ABII88_08730 [Candidatus Omnitrophota bacterium]
MNCLFKSKIFLKISGIIVIKFFLISHPVYAGSMDSNSKIKSTLSPSVQISDVFLQSIFSDLINKGSDGERLFKKTVVPILDKESLLEVLIITKGECFDALEYLELHERVRKQYPELLLPDLSNIDSTEPVTEFLEQMVRKNLLLADMRDGRTVYYVTEAEHQQSRQMLESGLDDIGSREQVMAGRREDFAAVVADGLVTSGIDPENRTLIFEKVFPEVQRRLLAYVAKAAYYLAIMKKVPRNSQLDDISFASGANFQYITPMPQISSSFDAGIRGEAIAILIKLMEPSADPSMVCKLREKKIHAQHTEHICCVHDLEDIYYLWADSFLRYYGTDSVMFIHDSEFLEEVSFFISPTEDSEETEPESGTILFSPSLAPRGPYAPAALSDKQLHLIPFPGLRDGLQSTEQLAAQSI